MIASKRRGECFFPCLSISLLIEIIDILNCFLGLVPCGGQHLKGKLRYLNFYYIIAGKLRRARWMTLN